MWIRKSMVYEVRAHELTGHVALSRRTQKVVPVDRIVVGGNSKRSAVIGGDPIVRRSLLGRNWGTAGPVPLQLPLVILNNSDHSVSLESISLSSGATVEVGDVWYERILNLLSSRRSPLR